MSAWPRVARAAAMGVAAAAEVAAAEVAAQAAQAAAVQAEAEEEQAEVSCIWGRTLQAFGMAEARCATQMARRARRSGWTAWPKAKAAWLTRGAACTRASCLRG